MAPIYYIFEIACLSEQTVTAEHPWLGGAIHGRPEGELESLEGSGETIAFGFCGAAGTVRGKTMVES